MAVQLSDEQFDKLLERVLERLAQKTAPPVDTRTGDQKFYEEFEKVYGYAPTQRRLLSPPELVPCKSDSGATFVAKVSNGRVVSLEGYTFPEGIDRHQHDGGLVPNGLDLTNIANGQESIPYKGWKFNEFWKRDINAFVGRPLPRWARVAEAAE